MGTAVFWGMLVATSIGVFLIPGNFAFVQALGKKQTGPEASSIVATPAPDAAH
jgi:hypothetical protein